MATIMLTARHLDILKPRSAQARIFWAQSSGPSGPPGIDLWLKRIERSDKLKRLVSIRESLLFRGYSLE